MEGLEDPLITGLKLCRAETSASSCRNGPLRSAFVAADLAMARFDCCSGAGVGRFRIGNGGPGQIDALGDDWAWIALRRDVVEHREDRISSHSQKRVTAGCQRVLTWARRLGREGAGDPSAAKAVVTGKHQISYV